MKKFISDNIVVFVIVGIALGGIALYQINSAKPKEIPAETSAETTE